MLSWPPTVRIYLCSEATDMRKGFDSLAHLVESSLSLDPLSGHLKHHDIDPFAYLQDVLRRLPSHPSGQLDELLPEVWFAAHPSARRKTAA